jgi:hypothetical protein
LLLTERFAECFMNTPQATQRFAIAEPRIEPAPISRWLHAHEIILKQSRTMAEHATTVPTYAK